MTMTRRRFVFLAGAALVAGPSRETWAQACCTRKALTFYLASPPGSITDILARALAKQISERSGQPAVVQNVPGDRGMVAVERTASSVPDGYTLGLLSNVEIALTPALVPKLRVNPQDDLLAVTPVATVPVVLAVSSASRINSVKDLVSVDRSKPGSLTLVSPGVGSESQLLGAALSLESGISFQNVQFRSVQAVVSAVASGDSSVAFARVPVIAAEAKAGNIRPIAVTGKQRVPQLPAVPTFAEQGLRELDFSGWYGLFGPKGIPREEVMLISNTVSSVLGTPGMKEVLLQLGMFPLAGSSTELASLVKQDAERWARVARAAKIQIN